MHHPYAQAGQRFLAWLKGSLSIVWLVVAAGYFAVVTVEAVYRNYQTRQRLQVGREQVAQLKQRQDELQALSVYYQSASFKELELRRNLLLKREGEAVYSLPETSRATKAAATATAGMVSAEKPASPYWRQWIAYLFGV